MDPLSPWDRHCSQGWTESFEGLQILWPQMTYFSLSAARLFMIHSAIGFPVSVLTYETVSIPPIIQRSERRILRLLHKPMNTSDRWPSRSSDHCFLLSNHSSGCSRSHESGRERPSRCERRHRPLASCMLRLGELKVSGSQGSDSCPAWARSIENSPDRDTG